MKKESVCPHCGAKMTAYWHSLSEMLCAALVHVYRYEKPVNIAEIGLTHNQVNNFQKLQYWNMVENLGSGIWRVTLLGEKFCQGKISMPKRVLTFRNKTVEFSQDTVYFKDVNKKEWDKIQDYIVSRVVIREGQAELF